eukprot:TRINITY_DN1668_c0_g1_i1.p1 TRINITY_DN1668_c0_g1~~TRINITY_DN1668_c0_g1_i1.p1  ORF type:complete len:202 (-),score=58.40 TRINITY_DN1668_c0_g1_i1:32-607(-)
MSTKSKDLAGLNNYLKAKSPQNINELFLQSFENRKKKITEEHLNYAKERFKEDFGNGDLTQTITSTKFIINECLFNLLNTQEKIESYFPQDFHLQLRGLVAKIIANHMPNWLMSSLLNQISLPKLKSFDWRLDVKNCSNLVNNISVPTILVQLLVDENGSDRTITFELSRETLSVMLLGLGKIRDQLNQLK